MKLESEHFDVPGLLRLRTTTVNDLRGTFLKVYQQNDWRQLGVEFIPREMFVTSSREGVVRGMHFQLPPKAHSKVVTCLQGSILDVVLDLRIGSPTEGMFRSFPLSADNCCLLFIPPGLAHGFVCLSPNSSVLYMTDCEYSPEHDAGVRWDSFGFVWPNSRPIVSERDARMPAAGDFQSPFHL